ncbi:MAG: YbaK/EbsC family protein [Anaerolineae bacterium]|nr:His/Gly/Thr/Pro-type tRNA ligase C-terminal domain-containing protein [Anaerolineae bacterium]MDW8068753.1 YbaK/EbsC family protein [Anaerolineae bacterium]
MLASRLFGRTLREPPADAITPGLGLMIRAAFLTPVEPGRYVWLPLGARVLEKARARLSAALEALGGQAMDLPVSVPEERALRALLPRHVASHRDLPRLLYGFHRRMADPPWGLWRWREREVLWAMVLQTDPATRDGFCEEVLDALRQELAHTGLEARRAEALDGAVLVMPHPSGEAEVLHCPTCGYAAVAEAARFQLPLGEPEPLEEVRPVATPDCPTIADVAAYVGVPTARTLKAVFYATGPEGAGEVVFVVIRGDLEVNETKLRRLLGGSDLRPATEGEIRAIGAVPGYASPVGLRVRPARDGTGVLVVGDRSIQAGANFVAGANRDGYHLTGVNYPRDFAVTFLEDVAQARAGLPCPECGAPLESVPGTVLASWWADRAVLHPYADPDGVLRPVAVGWCRAEPEGWVAAVAETCRDEWGLIWPPALAPFDVHLVVLGKDEPVRETAESICRLLAGQVLCDDRDESAGVKFADADLIGCPVRLTVSRRSLEAGGVEVKARTEKERRVVPVDQVAEYRPQTPDH